MSLVKTTRDRAFISMLIDSGGRLSEICSIGEPQILWDRHVARTIAKGGREVMLTLSTTSEALLKDWFTECPPNGGSI